MKAHECASQLKEDIQGAFSTARGAPAVRSTYRVLSFKCYAWSIIVLVTVCTMHQSLRVGRGGGHFCIVKAACRNYICWNEQLHIGYR
tara:strand:+ start:3782 stop:4045 length:264 start_codon:yes stop_codon:yes gene_type:complete